ncbi:hypothetical protein KCV01_g24456, partial [Aureobasidium melanogenum]
IKYLENMQASLARGANTGKGAQGGTNTGGSGGNGNGAGGGGLGGIGIPLPGGGSINIGPILSGLVTGKVLSEALGASNNAPDGMQRLKITEGTKW